MDIILFQISLFLVIVVALFIYCTKYNKKSPLDDIGVLWIFVLFLYSVAPALSFYFQDGVYLTWLSGRLFSLQPTIEETIQLLNISLSFAFGFSIVYLITRKNINPSRFNVNGRIKDKLLFSSLLLFIVSKLFVYFLYITGLIATPQSYIEEYKVISEAPTLIRQVLKVVSVGGSICFLVCIVGLFQRWPKSRFAILGIILFIIATFNPDSSRTALVVSFLTMLICWHVYVKKIRTVVWMPLAFVGLIVFILLGEFRGTDTTTSNLIENAFGGLGEFESIWANSVEMLQEKNKGNIDVPFNVRFNEFWQFIPSQLLPFEKQSISGWYLSKYYTSFQERGGGWAFGSIAQAALGGGVFEAFLRGSLLGLFYYLIFRYQRSNSNVWWSFPLYLHFLIFSYQSIRDTTFSQISEIFQILLPTFLLIWFFSLFFEWRKSP